jgi:rabenosyn-5
VPDKGKGKEKEEPLQEDEKFLKGVRICRRCRPVLRWVVRSILYVEILCLPVLVYRQQQYHQEVAHVPTFVRLYDVSFSFTLLCEVVLTFFQVFISLEKEIEDSLPQFQELLLTLRSALCISSKYI